jgi:hypothetical protein
MKNTVTVNLRDRAAFQAALVELTATEVAALLKAVALRVERQAKYAEPLTSAESKRRVNYRWTKTKVA